MAAGLQVSGMLLLSGSPSSCCSHKRLMVGATLNAPKIRVSSPLCIPKLFAKDIVEELNMGNGSYRIATTSTTQKGKDGSDPLVIAKLYAILEAVADRVEMHKNIGEQRDNWNHLLLTAINAITLTAATMCGLAAASASGGAPLAGLKVSSTVLYLAATGMLAIMNKIQPSQLAEEQRNAARLFKQLHGQIQTLVTIGNPTANDINEAMENVLALDKAYPLPLLGAMLEKYPSSVEPAVWWPQPRQKQAKGFGKKIDGNGWNRELEDEMRKIVGVLRRKDKADYLRLSEKALKVHKMLAISGPLFTGLAALGSVFAGTNSWAAVLGIVGGALASVVNTVEHGGQVGMVFEMYRSNAGFFKLLEETIESNMNERNVWGRENGEVLEMKVALQLGRSLSELKHLAASSSRNIEEITDEEFASMLF